MLEGVLKGVRMHISKPKSGVSILGMLEGVLKGCLASQKQDKTLVSILGMLEGVLKDDVLRYFTAVNMSFNPWYVGGGVKRAVKIVPKGSVERFNPWYVGGGVKRVTFMVL